MSNESFRRDLNGVFDDIAGSPSSNFRDRVRGAVAAPPESRPVYWMAALAAAVIAVLLVGVLVVGGPLRGSFAPAGGPHGTPSPSSGPTAGPTATPSQQAPFVCSVQAMPAGAGTPPPLAYISALRTGSHAGYDRLAVEFANGVPSSVDVAAHATTFTLSPSGQSITLRGDHAILITIHGSDLHTSYSGSADTVTGDPTIAEVRRVQDFEGVVQLGIGVNGSGCYRVTWMSGPDRLVIDVQAAP
ncbi:MAG TPA: hypothetical protein VKE27_01715 [Candidatus Dormibacteraeota bacterium]|nr:hypothetical protein [Candidatus Dormibacteraeota bacterium]